jgi:PadR family transcriptional regulator PadR
MGLQLWVTQFRKGLVELCVMATLAEGEAYGYQIVERLGQVSGLTITESTVYPLLARLGRDGLLAVRSAPSSSGPPRRYYHLTEAGRKRLEEMAAHWQLMQQSVNLLLKGVHS